MGWTEAALHAESGNRSDPFAGKCRKFADKACRIWRDSCERAVPYRLRCSQRCSLHESDSGFGETVLDILLRTALAGCSFLCVPIKGTAALPADQPIPEKNIPGASIPAPYLPPIGQRLRCLRGNKAGGSPAGIFSAGFDRRQCPHETSRAAEHSRARKNAAENSRKRKCSLPVGQEFPPPLKKVWQGF